MGFDTIFGRDTDTVFAYETDKLVRIRDRRLGLLYYLFLILIFAYVVLFRIVYNGAAYLQKEGPIGSVRFSLLRPLADPSCDKSECPNNYTAMTELPYCSQYQGPSPVKFRRPCEFKDAQDIFIIEEMSAFTATRVSESAEVRVCGSTESECSELFRSVGKSSYFPADVEAYTFLVDHNFRTAAIGVNASSRYATGLLHVEANSDLCRRTPGASAPTAPCTIPPNTTSAKTGLDVFRFGTLLESVSLDLDAQQGSKNTSIRADGVIMVLEIEYSNFRPWFGASANVSYTYKPSLLPQVSYKTEDAIYKRYPETRTWRDMHGVKVVVVQTGTLGRFDFGTLLVELTTSLALLATAAAVVDALALYFMPERRDYRKAKIQVTADFSDLRERRAHGGTSAPLVAHPTP